MDKRIQFIRKLFSMDYKELLKQKDKLSVYLDSNVLERFLKPKFNLCDFDSILVSSKIDMGMFGIVYKSTLFKDKKFDLIIKIGFVSKSDSCKRDIIHLTLDDNGVLREWKYHNIVYLLLKEHDINNVVPPYKWFLCDKDSKSIQ